MGAQQTRFLSYASCYDPAPVVGVACFPQGDAWSPAVLAATIIPAARRLARHPLLAQCTFLGDRALLAAD
eukprot:3779280-Alexandrium_andersonii.AAC.1